MEISRLAKFLGAASSANFPNLLLKSRWSQFASSLELLWTQLQSESSTVLIKFVPALPAHTETNYGLHNRIRRFQSNPDMIYR